MITPGLSFARAYCARLTRANSENFTVASVLLPRRLLPHFHAVYAFCRWADDLADETGDNASSLLAWWRSELAAMYADRPRHPITVALRETVRRFAIPPTPFESLLSAFEQDQRVTRYATFAQLRDYCRRSADPVGHMVLYLFGCFTPGRAALADEVCTGLQLANFWQDVARDFTIGRVYLPAEDCARFGVPEADLAARRFTPAFADLMRFQVSRTRGHFDRGEGLLPLLSRAVRADVGLFLRGGRAVLTAIEGQGFDVLSRRPTVSKWAKGRMLAAAIRANLTG
jgi:squalene synthase HpnC